MKDYPQAAKKLVAELREAHPDLHLQDIYRRPEVAFVYRAAWKDAPAEVRARIDAHFHCCWRKPSNKTAERFRLLSHYYTGGAVALDQELAHERETHLQITEGVERMKRERSEREQAERIRMAQLKRMTPQERAERHAAHRRRRIEKSMRMLQAAMDKGQKLMHKGKCFLCLHPLTDPVSRLYGIGPDCRRQMREALGAAQAAPFLENIKRGVAEESGNE